MKRYRQHVFDPVSLYYGSETGNWWGICRNCGEKFITYTGARSIQPRLTIPRTVRIFSFSPYEDREDWEVYFCEHLKQPASFITYPACSGGI